MAVSSDIRLVFSSYCGSGSSEMDGRSFTKLCKDSGLIGKTFSATDSDLVFAKALPKGQRKVSLSEFEVALVLVAERRGCEVQEVFDIVADAGGPSLRGTKAEPVRFHDDKGTYTGTHARGGPDMVAKGRGHLPQGAAWPLKPEPGAARRSSSRSSLTEGRVPSLPNLLAPPIAEQRKRPSPRTPSELTLPSPLPRSRSSSRQPSPCSDGPSMLGRLERGGGLLELVFELYCGAGKCDMDGKAFVKLLKDSRVVDRSFSVTDADLAFTKAAKKGQRRIDFQQFRGALLQVAEKKGVDAGEVYEAVARQRDGPLLTGTKTEAVRFHDDLNTYTGVHAMGGPESVPKGSGTATQLAAASMRYSA